MPMNDGDSISFAREPSVWEKLRERAIYKVVILGEAGVGKTSLLASTQTEGIPEDIPVLKEMQEAYTDMMFEFGRDHEMLPTYDWPVMYQYSKSDEKDCRLLLCAICRE